jgi:hypothetical protein
MTGTMPYSLEKGPYFEVLEDFINGSVEHITDTLEALRNGDAITSIPSITSTTLDVANMDLQYRINHVNQHWFGKYPDQTGAVQPQAPYDALSNPSTGFWLHWYGDAEAIFRQTSIRAIEVALGLNHGEALPSRHRVRRRWPIHFLWKCPQPWFEGWVSWHRTGRGDRDGEVTMIFATPGHGIGLRNTPLRPPGEEKTPAGYELEPKSSDGDLGMWVITHAYHAPRVITTTIPSGSGNWPPIATLGNAYQSTGPVVCVAPPEQEGGVLPGGRAFVAPANP